MVLVIACKSLMLILYKQGLVCRSLVDEVLVESLKFL